MALFTVLKALVDDNINTNGIQYITGAIHNDVMNELIDAVGAAQVYVNPATTDNPGTPANNRAYIALPGVYTNFGGLEITGSFGVLSWDGTSWSVENFNIGGNDGMIRRITTAALTAATTITSVAIEEVDGLAGTSHAGNWMRIINRRNGRYEYFQLTAQLLGSATTMSVASYTLDYDYPIGSIIEAFPTIGMRYYNTRQIAVAGLNYVNVEFGWRMPPVEGDAAHESVYMELLTVFRDGIMCKHDTTPTTSREYKIDPTDRTKLIFGTDFVGGEEVYIRFYQPTPIT